MQIIAFENDQGLVSILTPANCGLSIEEIARKDIPLLNGSPRGYLIIDDSDLPDRQYRNQWRISNGAVIIDNQVAPPVRFPDWDNLYARLLAGDLKPLFLNLKWIAKTDNAIAIDFMSLSAVLSNIRTEQALKDCLGELIEDGYIVSDEHRTLWNNAIAELNFSDLVKI